MKNILLVGGTGFLGVNIAIALIAQGFNVFLVGRRCQHLRHEERLAGVAGFYEEDVLNAPAILRLVDDAHIDCMVNLVSTLIPSSGWSAFASEVERCTLPAFGLMPELAHRGVKYVFFSSGGTVYGQSAVDAELMSEHQACQPVNLYGYSKLIFEQYLGLCARMHALQYLVIRPSNPYGFYQNPVRMQGFIAVAMHKLLQGKEIEIWGDGSVVRDYIFVKDMAHAFVALLARDLWGEVFNIGSGTGSSLSEVLTAMQQVSGKKAKVRYKSSRSVDVSRVILDIAKLKSVIDFQPMSLVNGLHIYHEGLINGAA